MDELIPRVSQRQVAEAMTEARVVVLNGPRQSGKSTLMELLAPRETSTRISLDDITTLRSVRSDPIGFLAAARRPVYIDEVQRGGDRLLLSIKDVVDRHHREPGQFVLAGSSRFLTVPTLSESLAGRVQIVDLWPLSQAEIDRHSSAFVETVLAGADACRAAQPNGESRQQVMDRLVRGGFPAPALARSDAARSRWFDSYVRTLLERDIAELSKIRQLADLPRLLRLVAARTGQELNVADLSRDASLTPDSTRSFLALFETIYLHFSIPSWSSNLTSRLVRRPKIHILDSGLCADILGFSGQSLADPCNALAGPVFESFVVSEIARLVDASGARLRLSHYRDKEQREVDLIIEDRRGSVYAIEVKATETVDDSDFRHLRFLRDRLGDRFANGLVISLGQGVVPFGEKLTAMPVTSLWAP